MTDLNVEDFCNTTIHDKIIAEWYSDTLKKLFDVYMDGVIATGSTSLERLRSGLALTRAVCGTLSKEFEHGQRDHPHRQPVR